MKKLNDIIDNIKEHYSILKLKDKDVEIAIDIINSSSYRKNDDLEDKLYELFDNLFRIKIELNCFMYIDKYIEILNTNNPIDILSGCFKFFKLVDKKILGDYILKYYPNVNNYVSNIIYDEIKQSSIFSLTDNYDVIYYLEQKCNEKGYKIVNDIYEFKNNNLELNSYLDEEKLNIKLLENNNILTMLEEKYLCYLNQYYHNKDAKNTLIISNLKYVVSLVHKTNYYNKQKTSINDLFQEGVIGLIEAIEKYDINSNNRLLTYSYYYILRGLNMCFKRNKHVTNRPLYYQSTLFNYYRKKENLEKKYNGNLSYELIAEKLNIPLEKVIEYEINNKGSISLDAKVKDNNDKQCNIDYVLDDNYFFNNIEKQDLKERLINIIEQILSLDKQMAIKYRFGLIDGNCYELSAIAQKLYEEGYKDRVISSEAIRTLINRAIKQIKEFDKTQDLKNYLELEEPGYAYKIKL